MTGDASDEEAAWRELVAQYAAPALAEGTPAPWPTREDLPGTAGGGRGAPDLGGRDTDGGGPDTADLDATDVGDPDADAEGSEDDEAADPPAASGGSSVPGVIPAPPQLRIVRPASPAPFPVDDDDDHYVPPVPPPLPRLDPLTKGAWVALFGGPAYLLIAVMLNWQVPGWAAFCAVAAFIGGFATLVVHMGERPPRDSGPDDGAVV